MQNELEGCINENKEIPGKKTKIVLFINKIHLM